MSVQTQQESFSFQAEAVQILDLMIHSLYSNKEIFLREIISNASDAIDRLRLELLSQSELPGAEGPLQIRVSCDKDAGTITVADNGIGMSRQEVIENIGTIARSGTQEFLQALTGDQRKDATLIGQFGVGFYSSFIVADRVVLTTRRSGLSAEEGIRWESDGKGEYTLETIERPDRGTTIVLQLREGEDDLLSGYRLRSIIQKYSDHISLPIMMPAESAGDAAWGRSTEYVKFAVEDFSRRWYPYPWPNAINVGGPVDAMEYPAVFFDAAADKGKVLFFYSVHEIGHTWFPMVVGFDEPALKSLAD